MAGKKRKAEAARLEETDRALYGAFRGAANSLSQLYTLAMGAQKASFQAGERHAMVRSPLYRVPIWAGVVGNGLRPGEEFESGGRRGRFLGLFFDPIGGELRCSSEAFCGDWDFLTEFRQ